MTDGVELTVGVTGEIGSIAGMTAETGVGVETGWWQNGCWLVIF